MKYQFIQIKRYTKQTVEHLLFMPHNCCISLIDNMTYMAKERPKTKYDEVILVLGICRFIDGYRCGGVCSAERYGWSEGIPLKWRFEIERNTFYP